MIANPLRLMEHEPRHCRQPSVDLPGLADCYHALRRFDADLRAHVLIEEHELYPLGLELEARLM